MNALNSILIEGNVVSNPERHETENGNVVCTFKIVSSRFFKEGTDLKKEDTTVSIETWGRLAELCAGTLKEGRGVRIVGRVRQGEDGNFKVVAEHAEFRPSFKA